MEAEDAVKCSGQPLSQEVMWPRMPAVARLRNTAAERDGSSEYPTEKMSRIQKVQATREDKPSGLRRNQRSDREDCRKHPTAPGLKHTNRRVPLRRHGALRHGAGTSEPKETM